MNVDIKIDVVISARLSVALIDALMITRSAVTLKTLCSMRQIMALILQKRASGEVQALASGRISRLEVVGKIGKKKTDLVKFRIAYDFVVSETSGNHIKQFINCCAYGRIANYAQHLADSDIVLVTGKLREDTYHEVKHPEDKYYIMVTTLFLQPLVFESPEKYRKRVKARKQGYVVEDEPSDDEFLFRENIKDDMATPNIQDEDLPF